MNVIELLRDAGIQPKKVSVTKGGEYHSPCPDPNCGGDNRFCVWPAEGGDGRYWCRRCERSGDAIQFCRDFLGMDFLSACARVGKRPTLSIAQIAPHPKEKFIPKALEIPSDKWRQRAASFVKSSHRYLLQHDHLLNQDKDRGLTRQSIIDFQLGWNPADIFEPRQLWGLPDVSKEGGPSLLCLPKGIVIPSFRESLPIRVKVRRHSWKPDDEYPKYHIVAGGMACPAIYGDINKPIVIVEAELDAMLIQRFASGLCCSIALGGVNIRPDGVVDEVLRKASLILYALDFDEAGKKAFKFWKSTYSRLKAWPVPKGKSPGDAYSLGVNLQNWILSGIENSKKNRSYDG